MTDEPEHEWRPRRVWVKAEAIPTASLSETAPLEWDDYGNPVIAIFTQTTENPDPYAP